MTEAKEILSAAARLLNAVAETLEKANNPLAVAPSAPAAPAAPAKDKKEKVKKPESIAAAPAPAAPAIAPVAPAANPNPAKELSAEDSLKEIRAIAKVFVQRFGAQADGLAAFRKIMADKTGAGKVDDLKHEQRLVVIAAIKAELAKADEKKPAPTPAATSSVEV